MENKTLFKIRQTVFDSALFGDLNGKVIDIRIGDKYPLRVQFGEYIYLYTLDGRFNTNMKPTLSDQPYKVEYVPPQPQIELPEVGQWCWFWDDCMGGYYYGQFNLYKHKDEYPYYDKQGHKYQYCSTKNPIEK